MRTYLLLVALALYHLATSNCVLAQEPPSPLDREAAWAKVRSFYCEGDSIGVLGCSIENPTGFSVSRQNDSLCVSTIDTRFVAGPWLRATGEMIIAHFRLGVDGWTIDPSQELEDLRERVTDWNQWHADDIRRLLGRGRMARDEAAWLLRGKRDLVRLAAAEEWYYPNSLTYTADTTQLNWQGTPGVHLTITYAGEYGWRAEATHDSVAAAACLMWYGTVPDTTPGTLEGIVDCRANH